MWAPKIQGAHESTIHWPAAKEQEPTSLCNRKLSPDHTEELEDAIIQTREALANALPKAPQRTFPAVREHGGKEEAEQDARANAEKTNDAVSVDGATANEAEQRPRDATDGAEHEATASANVLSAKGVCARSQPVRFEVQRGRRAEAGSRVGAKGPLLTQSAFVSTVTDPATKKAMPTSICIRAIPSRVHSEDSEVASGPR